MANKKPSLYRTFRCKAKCGLSVKWTIRNFDGKWRIVGLGDAKNGRSPVPTAFIPFELSNEVMRANKPSFPSAVECEAYAKSL